MWRYSPIMNTQILMTRLGGTAIAAVLALTATPALAQEAAPQDVPQISVPDEPAPTTTSTTTTTTVEALAAADPLAAEPVAAAPVVSETRATTSRSTTSRAARPTASAPARPTALAAPVAVATDAASVAEPVPAPLDEVPVAPLAAAPSVEPVPAPPAQLSAEEDVLPIALGAGLGMLALGGAAFALTRRRRRDAVLGDSIIAEPRIRRDAPMAPVIPTPGVASSPAPPFTRGTAPPALPGPCGGGHGTLPWRVRPKAGRVARGHRGPTRENPFLSLKKRFHRAAFYDQRERAVAAGKARPLSPMAGLPQRFADVLRSRPAAPAGTAFAYA